MMSTIIRPLAAAALAFVAAAAAQAQTTVKEPWVRGTVAQQKATGLFGRITSKAGGQLVIDAPNGTFGYDILSDGRLFVHQTNVPGRPGIEGCRTRMDAERLAGLVVEKISKGEMPPTISAEELTALGIAL